MKNNLRAIFGVVTIICGLLGCDMVNVDSSVNQWNVVRRDVLNKVNIGEIRTGMPRGEVEAMCGKMLQCQESICELKNQFVLITPGFYPYFDSRRVILEFDEGKLKRIRIVGAHNVYW